MSARSRFTVLTVIVDRAAPALACNYFLNNYRCHQQC